MANIYRKKSLERAKDPEQLDDYIRVTSPGVWMILAVVILLLVGFLVWGLFGTIEDGGTAHRPIAMLFGLE
jgi:uncharacterized membrane protein